MVWVTVWNALEQQMYVLEN